MSPELLDMIRNDQQPLAAYGVAGLTPRVALMLSRVIQVCQQLYATSANSTSPSMLPWCLALS